MLNRPARNTALALVLVLLTVLSALAQAPAKAKAAPARFEVSFPPSAHAGPITGRVFVIVSRRDTPELRLQIGDWMQQTAFFGVDVSQWQPGQATAVDSSTLGYPLNSLSQIPAGDYYVQALVNVYTEFHRSDGHTIWGHMDQWEGQQFNRSPGNLYSEVRKVHLDPSTGYNVNLTADKVIPPVQVPPDTRWVKRVKIQSALLTKFWGHPMYLGATVLLPKGYDSHPAVRYPAVYEQGHFSLEAPMWFTSDESTEASRRAARIRRAGFETGYSFYQKWNSPDFPRMIVITFQHPTVYFDDSYAVNSANDGPYGDALMTELIPYLEEHFRMIRKPYARVLTGGSTGGWESLALQLFHPEFFGGTWTFFPDPIDFRRYQLVNIYQDENAFLAPGFEWVQRERPMMRTAEGQVVETMRQMSQLESVLGSHGRSGQQFEAWEAVYGPVGPDGYPKPLWDKATGKIDPEVALYMRDHGYDLRYYLEQNWSKIGPQLVGKLHLYCGDMDNFYLNVAVYMFQEYLQGTENPHYEGTFEYGRPMKGHGWHPMDNSTLLHMMADHITKNAPPGEETKAWNYQ